MKEPFIFDILELLFKINSIDNYQTFKTEISVTLKVIINLMNFDQGQLLLSHYQTL